MNLVKQIVLWCATVGMISVFAYSCKGEEAVKAPGVSFSVDSLTMEKDSVKQVITINSCCNWQIKPIDTAWLSFSTMSGPSGSSNVTISAIPNKTPYTRQAVVTVSIMGISSSEVAKLHIAQNGISGDRGTLMKIYDKLRGDNWSSNANWNSDLPLSQWRGIVADKAGNVTSLDIDKYAYGELPLEVFDLLKLEAICLQWCPDIKGAISPQIKKLRKLRTFWAAGTSLTSIPAEIGELPSLQELTFSGAKITHITPEIGNIKTLRKLDLSSNALQGGIPDGFGDKLLSLTQLSLSNNPELKGELPASLFTDDMTLISVFGCSLTGSIPMEIGRAVNLETLRLSDNMLAGSIPESIGNLTNLTTLNLDNNSLMGNIPESLANIPSANNLQMNLSQNELSGTISQSIINHPSFANWKDGICDQKGVGFTNCPGLSL